MTSRTWPNLTEEDIENLSKWVREVTRTRDADISEFEALNAFINKSYEVVNLTPSASQNDYDVGITLETEKLQSTIRIAPTNSIQITGISATLAKNAKRITIENATSSTASTARCIILPRESTSSTAANRFTYAHFGMPIILMPGDTVTFSYSTTDSRWRYISSTRSGGFRHFFDTFSDMGAAPSDMQTTASGAGAGAALPSSFIASTQKALGMWGVSTGTTAGGYCYTGTGNTQMKGGSGAAIFMGRFAPETLSDGTETYTARAGFNDSASTGTPVDGVYWEYDSTTSTDWRTCTLNNSVATKTTITGFTVSATVLHYLGIFMNGDWTNAEFFYSTDGQTWVISSTQHTTNIPTDGARLFGAMFGLTKSAGTTTRFFDSDWMGWRYDILRGA